MSDLRPAVQIGGLPVDGEGRPWAEIEAAVRSTLPNGTVEQPMATMLIVKTAKRDLSVSVLPAASRSAIAGITQTCPLTGS